MGLTLDEAERIGLAREHPDHPSNRKPSKAKRRGLNVLGQNKTEAAFDRYCQDLEVRHAVLDYRWEPIKIRLAGRTSLRIDFLVLRLDRTVAAVEVKGFMRDDAAVKIKVAPDVCPFFDYYVAWRDGQGWEIRRVDRKGIGRYHEPDWLVCRD